MIFQFVIDFFLSCYNWAVSLIPQFNWTLDISGYVAPMADAFGYIDTIVSLDVLVLCITTILIVDNWSLIVHLVVKIWELLPFN